jgi:hypothetical protein
MSAALACPDGYVGVDKTTVWGPSFWRLIHCLAWSADPHDTLAFCELLRKVLPCRHCRASYDHYCDTTPLHCFLTSREDMAAWSFFIHDAVDLKLEKSTVSYSSFVKRMKQCEWCVTDSEVFAVLFSCMYAALLEDDGATGAAAQLPSVVRRAMRDSPVRAARFLPQQVLTVTDMLHDLLGAYNAYRETVGLRLLVQADVDGMFLIPESEDEARDRRTTELPKRERSDVASDPPHSATRRRIALTLAGVGGSGVSSNVSKPHDGTVGRVRVDVRRVAVPIRTSGSGTHSFRMTSTTKDFTR